MDIREQHQIDFKSILPSSLEKGYLKGVISLRWPYSASRRTLSICLSHEDIRKRSDKGQIKLTFHGTAAHVIKDLPLFTPLQVSSASDYEVFCQSHSDSQQADYCVTFTGEVTIARDGHSPTVLDSTNIPFHTSPAKIKRTWMTPNLKRSAPADGLALEEAWFSPSDSTTKRVRYSNNFKLVGSPRISRVDSVQKSFFIDKKAMSMPNEADQQQAEQSQDLSILDHEIFDFQKRRTPTKAVPDSIRVVRSDLKDLKPEADQSQHASPQKESSTQTEVTVNSNDERVDAPGTPEIDNGQLHSSSIPGPQPCSGFYQDALSTAHQIHLHTEDPGNVSPTSNDVPTMSLESAAAQEALRRKLQASAPPKSGAGSSNVDCEDHEIGGLAGDPKSSVLDTKQGILSGKVTLDKSQELASIEQGFENDAAIDEQTGHDAAVGSFDSFTKRPDTGRLSLSRSILEEHDNPANDSLSAGISVVENLEEARSVANSPSMTERGAAVQESVFRSKIRLARGNGEISCYSNQSVKSATLAESAAMSVDHSVHENIEETVLDRQTSAQETLFREKLNRSNTTSAEGGDNLSMLGQADAPASNVGTLRLNSEPTLLEQQSDVQENIFREKVRSNDQKHSDFHENASLDHMEQSDTPIRAYLSRKQEELREISPTCPDANSTRSVANLQEYDRLDENTEIGQELNISDTRSKISRHSDIGYSIHGDASEKRYSQKLCDQGDASPIMIESDVESETELGVPALSALVVDHVADEIIEDGREPPDASLDNATLKATASRTEVTGVEAFLHTNELEPTKLSKLDHVLLDDTKEHECYSDDKEGSESPRYMNSAGKPQPVADASRVHRENYYLFDIAPAARFDLPQDVARHSITQDRIVQHIHRPETPEAASGEHISVPAERSEDGADQYEDSWPNTRSAPLVLVTENSTSGEKHMETALQFDTGTADAADAAQCARSTEIMYDSSERSVKEDTVTAATMPQSQILVAQDQGSEAGMTSLAEEVVVNKPTPEDVLETELGYHESISSLRFERVVDLLGIVVQATVSRTKGPDTVWQAIILQASGKWCSVLIFRPFSSALPTAKDGDILLLRSFKVISLARKLCLRSQDDSAWAVLHFDADHRSANVSVPGPPVEYTTLEVEHAQKLSSWWHRKGHYSMPNTFVVDDPA